MIAGGKGGWVRGVRRLRRFTQMKDRLVNGSAKADAINLADKDRCDIVEIYGSCRL